MELPKKKRCCICRRKFRPDPRVKDRQRACSREVCQRQRRSKTQASWRARNRDYRNDSYLRKRSATARAAERGDRDGSGDEVRPPEPLPVPPALESVPWDFVQAEMGVSGCDVLRILAVLLVRLVKDQIGAEKSLFMRTYAPVTDSTRKDE